MRRSFYVLTISFFAGVCIRSVYEPSLPEVVFCSLCVGVLSSVLRRETYALYLALAVVVCVLGVVRTEFAFRTYEETRVFSDGSVVELQGYVSSEPDVREDDVVLVMELTAQHRTLRVRTNVPLFPVYQYGDRVTVRGTLVEPRPFATEEGRIFRFDRYLMKEDVHYLVRDATIERIGTRGGTPIREGLLALKNRWLRAIAELVPEPEASLAGGVVVGAKRSLGDTWLEAFRATGIIHIVVLSGYNLTLVANDIMRVCSFLPRITALMFGSVGVCAFALMTGGGATVVRASIMAIIGMLAAYMVRPHTLVRLLALAGVCMVWWNPFVLVFDTGFQLSFIATLGLVLGAPIISRKLTHIPEAFQLREIAAATLATQCAVLPLLLYQIGEVSLIAPIVNMLVLPLVPLAMFFAFTAGLCGSVTLALGMPLAWVATGLLRYIFSIVEVSASVPYASVALPPVPLWVPFLLYAGLCAGVWWVYRTAPIDDA